MAIRAKTHRLHYAHLGLGYYSLDQAECCPGSFRPAEVVVRQVQMEAGLEEVGEDILKGLGLVPAEDQEAEEGHIPCSLEVDTVGTHGTGQLLDCHTCPGRREVHPESGGTEGNRRRPRPWEVIEIVARNDHRARHARLVHHHILKRHIRLDSLNMARVSSRTGRMRIKVTYCPPVALWSAFCAHASPGLFYPCTL